MKCIPTPFLFKQDNELLRAVRIQVPGEFNGPARVDYQSASETRQVEAQVDGGLALVPLQAHFDTPTQANINLSCSSGVWQSSLLLPPTRPWTIYLAQDKHLDYGWIHPVEDVLQRTHAMIDYYLDAAAQSSLHWNMDTSIWVEEYLSERPEEQRQKLIAALRSGAFETGAFFITSFPAYLGAEEILQSLSISTRMARKHNIPLHTVCLQEVPSLPWGIFSILAGAGFPQVVKGAYELRNPHLREKDAPSLAWWQGPDGKAVMVRWDAYDETHSWGGYAEAKLLWRSGNTERAAFIENTARRYDYYPVYPIDAILLVGVGHDEYPQTAAISNFIEWFNRQGWSYPRLIDSTYDMFWQDANRQIEQEHVQLPVVCGDLGASWDEWPGQLAYLSAICRQSRETLRTAQALSAIVRPYDPLSDPIRQTALQQGWRNVLLFSDHNIGGISPWVNDDMCARRSMYAMTAQREGRRALESALSALAVNIRPPAGNDLPLVLWNPHSWRVSEPVEIVLPEEETLRGCEVFETESGRRLDCQVETHGIWPEHYLAFTAEDLPPVGYRCYSIRRTTAAEPQPAPESSVFDFANDFFALKINPSTGAITSLIEKSNGVDWIEKGDYGANQFLHFSGGAVGTTQFKTIGHTCTALSLKVTVEMEHSTGKVRSTITLPRTLPWIEILNEVEKAPTSEPQASWFAFPWDLPGGTTLYDSPGSLLRAGMQTQGGDWLPGAARTCLAIQTFAACVGTQRSVILASPDAHLVQLGKNILAAPTADSDAGQTFTLSTALHNFTRNDWAVNQGGFTHFAFRYRVGFQTGQFDPAAALRFARQAACPPRAIMLKGDPRSSLETAPFSFASVSPENVLIDAIGAAEDGTGVVVRLWECAGIDSQAILRIPGLPGLTPHPCDLLGRVSGEDPSLHTSGDAVSMKISARSLKSIVLR